MEAPAAMDAEDDDARGFKAVFTAAGEELLQGRMREKLPSRRPPPGTLPPLAGSISSVSTLIRLCEITCSCMLV